MSEGRVFERYYGHRVALDTMLFIYHLEERVPYVALTASLLRAIEQGYIQGVASSLVFMEVLVRPYREGRTDLAARYQSLLEAFPHLTIVPFGKDEASRAATLRAEFPSLRPADAIVLATALSQNAQVFVTTDKRLRVVQAVIEIIVLEDLLHGDTD